MVETDKYASGLIYYYQEVLSVYEGSIDRVLEVGIDKGGFIYYLATQLLKDRNTQYYGIDIRLNAVDERVKALNHEGKLKLFAANQKNSTDLLNCAQEIEKDGLLDVVVDDGAHGFVECVNTFNVFWSLLRDGGFYFIEDWGAYIQHPYHATYKSMRKTCDFLLDNINKFSFHSLNFIYHPAPRYSIITIRKGYV